MSYYIVCKRHGKRKDFALTFWGKDRCGYTFDLNEAGVYSEEEAQTFTSPCDDAPVPVDVVDKLSILQVIDGRRVGRVCKNSAENRMKLNIKNFELQPGDTFWGPSVFSSPEEFLNRHKHTEELLKTIRNMKAGS